MFATLPSIMNDIMDFLPDVEPWMQSFAIVFTMVLFAAAVIWTSAIAWRKFKEATNKV